ncbi:hypothetical protein CHLRE_17g722526v5 [Chlamydomonas reinhardtii]|uniref:Uncharacterized protein n=1 Tax=Chlamydomonas reinhardtii TaxID=3055 RepID=A0A2K3CQE4_CHLRE|nr:uncharacterized protein CHLRE_17g722526v5 [Chlamydomonas reinhardtii]PNW70501.1 hypothetical protein CHLRE_17g722526v5 [Chlamydomonas reinhardtii]
MLTPSLRPQPRSTLRSSLHSFTFTIRHTYALKGAASATSTVDGTAPLALPMSGRFGGTRPAAAASSA